MAPLKLFTDLSLLNIGTRRTEILIPILGQDDFEKNPDTNLSAGRFDLFEKTGTELIQLTSLEECDACLLPVYYPQNKDNSDFEKRIEPFINIIKGSGKKTIVYVGAEKDEFEVKIENAVVIYNMIYASKRKKNEFTGNSFFEDFIERYYKGILPVRPKKEIPSIGFCGYAPPLGQKWGKFKIKETARLLLNYAGFIQKFPAQAGHSYRARALKSILKSNSVEKDIVIREKFGFGGPYGALYPGGSKELNPIFRENYVKNIVDTDYTLCVRGLGNYSIRFFEALCCGRIPVFINTDSVLPFEFEIDWKKYCVFIEEKDIDKIPEKVLQFHKNLSPAEFEQMQRNCRQLWEEYLSPTGYFKNIRKLINQF